MFDTGNYAEAVEQKIYSENISKVLYPNDGTPQGRDLRLRQQYFFVACSLRDIIRRFQLRNNDWNIFPDKVAIQLNDTHPVIAIPELMRILLDEVGLNWEQAWRITQRTFAYTCHTLLPEALEKWPVSLFELPAAAPSGDHLRDQPALPGTGARPLPRRRRARGAHVADRGRAMAARCAWPTWPASAASPSTAWPNCTRSCCATIRCATLPRCIPDRFQNKTNGVSPRRFMKMANPQLCDLITAQDRRRLDQRLERLRELEAFVDDAEFRHEWRAVKRTTRRIWPRSCTRAPAWRSIPTR